MAPCACLGISFLLSLAAMQNPTEPLPPEYKKAPGPHQAAEALYDWHDDQRDRDVPVKIYYPKNGSGPFPVVFFSHGLGGSRETYAYLGRHWASHGYVSVHVQHVGSDDGVWSGQADAPERMKQAAADRRNALNRPPDIRFALERLERLNHEDGPLKGRMDLSELGMAGHSFGAFTTMAVAGQAFLPAGGRGITVEDWRLKFKAAVVMSPNAPRRRDSLEEIYAQIRIPILHMTGTRDDSPINDSKAADRRVPFDHIKNADQYLVVFESGDHMVFSGRKRLRGQENSRDARFQELIRMSTTAFWDAYLKRDAAAKAWLNEGGFQKVMGRDGAFEKKSASRPAP